MIKQLPHLLLLVFIFSFPTYVYTQDFTVNGNANFNTINNYYELTPNAQWQVGSVWYNTKLDLSESFQIDFEIYLGDHESGADGISFGLQPLSTGVGTNGGGIGLGGISPVFAIEFDTYQNIDLNDPADDHIAIVTNGINDHGTPNTLDGPFITSQMEDDQWHRATFVWNANTKKFQAFYDCQPAVSYQGDIVNTIFGNQPEVFWGFTSATGGESNPHRIRFLDYQIGLKETVKACINDLIELTAPDGVSWEWYDESGSLLSTNQQLSVVASPTNMTKTYTVEVTPTVCKAKILKSFYLVEANIITDLGNDISTCQKDTAIQSSSQSVNTNFTWYKDGSIVNGETNQSLTIKNSGTYKLQIDSAGCSHSDEIQVELNIPTSPQINLPSGVQCAYSSGLITLTPHSGSTYEWKIYNQANDNISIDKKEVLINYSNVDISLTLIETNNKGCIDSITQTIPIQFDSKPMITANDICLNETKSFNVTNRNGSYNWAVIDNNQNTQITTTNNEEIAIQGIKEGTFLLSIKETLHGCDLHDTITVRVNPLPSISINISDNQLCQFDTPILIAVSPSGGTLTGQGLNGFWFTPLTLTPNKNYPINYQFTDSKGCTAKTTKQLEVVSVPNITIDIKDSIICLDKQTEMKITDYNPAYNYQFYLNNQLIAQDKEVIQINEAGIYHAAASNKACTILSGIKKLKTEDIAIEVSEDKTILINELTTLAVDYTVTPSTQTPTIIWSTSSTFINSISEKEQITVSPTTDQTYYTKAVTPAGCEAEASIFIEVIASIKIPSMITPNGDGLNDRWIIEHIENYPNAKINLFNRWGNLVFTQVGYENDWEGLKDGQLLPSAVYYYVIKLNSNRDDTVYSGSLTIMR